MRKIAHPPKRKRQSFSTSAGVMCNMLVRLAGVDSNVADMVRSGTVNLHEGNKLIKLPDEARRTAVEALASGADIRAAVRAARSRDYNERIQAAKPKALRRHIPDPVRGPALDISP